MTAATPEPARQIAGRLAEAFEHDCQLAEQQSEAQHRLQAANDRLLGAQRRGRGDPACG